jgi:hypothetical protein
LSRTTDGSSTDVISEDQVSSRPTTTLALLLRTSTTARRSLTTDSGSKLAFNTRALVIGAA